MTLFSDFDLVAFCSGCGYTLAFDNFYFYQPLRAAIRRLILPPATTVANRQISAADLRNAVPVITSPREK